MRNCETVPKRWNRRFSTILTRMEDGMGILSGLKGLGLGSLEGMSLFEEPKKKEVQQKAPVIVVQKPEEKESVQV